MKKNIILGAIALAAFVGIENAVFFGSQANEMHAQTAELSYQLSEAGFEIDSLQEINIALEAEIEALSAYKTKGN